MLRTQEALSTGSLTVSRQLAASLQGQTRDRYSLSDSSFDEGAYIAATKQAGFAVIVCWYYTARLELLCFYGEYQEALVMATEAEEWAARSAGYYFTTELSFYAGLTLAILHRSATLQERERYAERLTAHKARLTTWAENCPQNFRHKLLLIAAEQARGDGQDSLALELYEQAIHLAQKNQFVHHEALASELYARFHLDKGREKVARVYLLDAYQGYLRWGATEKALQLAEAYPVLLPAPALAAETGQFASATSSPAKPTELADLLNVETALRAAQAIATEVELDKVLSQLMRVVIANAGAQRGFLLLMRQEVLSIAASISVDPDTVRVGMLVPVEECEDLAVPVVQYVSHTRQTVVLGDASRDERFASAPYILDRRPKSILCLPLVHQGRLTGVLYVENNVAYDAFTAGHTQLLGLLCSQAAIAVENAMLYARMEEASLQLQRVNEHLEEEVKKRTEQLREINERLQAELGQREEAEKRRAALQEELIRVQRDMLAEMSTPLIPITDRLMVMPLVGAMDTDRAEQAVETALRGVQAQKAQVVIVDITGIKNISTNVSGILIRMAQALHLLGAQAVLTGIRAEVAAGLVSLGVDLRGIVTRSTLQAGIAYALSRVKAQGLGDLR
jgi:GAF domain-containing protein